MHISGHYLNHDLDHLNLVLAVVRWLRHGPQVLDGDRSRSRPPLDHLE